MKKITQMVEFVVEDTPSQIVDKFKAKGLLLTYNYDELQKDAHNKAFTVAKVTRMDLLSDIHDSLVKSQKSGANFQAWKKEILPTLEKKGWWGEKSITNPKTGEVKEVVIDSRRLKTIYSTNMRVSNSQYRYKQMMSLENSVYWMYRSALLENTRATHKQLHGSVFHRDHSFWQKNYPPNDWNCKCKVTAHSKRDIEKRDITPIKNDVPPIAGKDWDYNVGDTSKVASLNKIDLSNAKTLRSASKNKAYEKLSNEDIIKTFYAKMGVKKGEVFIDKTNDPIIINDNLFLDKKTSKLKIDKEDRHLFLDEMVETIKNPDEIYLEYDKYGLKKNMFRYFDVNGKKEGILAVFRYFKNKTQGATIFHVTRELEKRREMKLVYQREAQ